jgi:dihydroorotase
MACVARPAFVAVLLRDNDGAEEFMDRVSDRGGVAVVVPVLSTQVVNRDSLAQVCP